MPEKPRTDADKHLESKRFQKHIFLAHLAISCNF